MSGPEAVKGRESEGGEWVEGSSVTGDLAEDLADDGKRFDALDVAFHGRRL